jgi:hypothetical protein
VLGPHRGTVEAQQAAAFEDAIDDGIGEIVIVKHGPPTLWMLVRGEDHRTSSDVAIVDDVVEDVGGVVAVGEVANLVDDEDVRAHVEGEGIAQFTFAGRGRETVDELSGGGEEHFEAVLKRSVGNGDGKVSLSTSRLALEDHRTAFGDKVGREQGSDRGEPQCRLVREVELLDGAQEGERRSAHGATEPRLFAMRDFFGKNRVEEVLIGPVFLLGALDEFAPDAASVGQMQALEERFEIGVHAAPPFRSARRKGSGTCWSPGPRGCATRT